jgi:GDPmannose 4,6-dehydratase
MESKRDWGYAADYVRAMWLMLQQDEPDDYVVATGLQHSVRDCARLAFKCVGLNYEDYIIGDNPADLRPADVVNLVGDASKAQAKLGWRPSVTFEQMVGAMVDADLAALKKTYNV